MLNEIRRTFEADDLEDLKFFLGTRYITNNERTCIKLSQEAYINQLAHRFNMENCSPKQTPAVVGKYLKKRTSLSDKENKQMRNIPFMELTGSLLWAGKLRADASFAI